MQLSHTTSVQASSGHVCPQSENAGEEPYAEMKKPKTTLPCVRCGKPRDKPTLLYCRACRRGMGQKKKRPRWKRGPEYTPWKDAIKHRLPGSYGSNQ